MNNSILTILTVLLLASCGDSDITETPINVCDKEVSINEHRYVNESSSSFVIVSAEITMDCLNINYSASGCSGDSWMMNLVASDAVAESDPEQRYIKLFLENTESCLAVFTKEISFDIGELKIQNDGKLLLNLDGYSDVIEYNY